MLSVLWVDDPSASPRVSNSLGLLLLSSLGAKAEIGGEEVGVAGLSGVWLLFVKSDNDWLIMSESVDPRVRGETSSELLLSGKMRNSSSGLPTEQDRCVGVSL